MEGTLVEELARLEEALASRGAVVASRLAPGANSAVVRGALKGAGLDASDEVLAWFGWHNGTDAESGEPIGVVEVAPGGEVCTLDQACAEYSQATRVAKELAEHPQVSFPAEVFWRPSWLPLLRLFGKGYVAVDLEGGGVFLAWHDDDLVEDPVPTWPTLAAFVMWISEQFNNGVYRVNEDGFVDGATMDRPAR